jgi:hypothetical protein
MPLQNFYSAGVVTHLYTESSNGNEFSKFWSERERFMGYLPMARCIFIVVVFLQQSYIHLFFKQGDQIGQMLAKWTMVSLGSCFEIIHKSSPKYWATLPHD